MTCLLLPRFAFFKAFPAFLLFFCISICPTCFAQNQPDIASLNKIGNGLSGFPNILNTDHFGGAIADIGDLDGDGVHDLAVGAYTEVITAGVTNGSVYILFMKSDGSVKSYYKNTTPSGALDFGISIASLGDLDGDGITDIAVGSNLNASSGGIKASGDVYVCFLSKTGKFKSAPTKIAGTSMTNWSSTQSPGPQFGKTIACIGDLNGDGLPDIIVGADQDKSSTFTVATGSVFIVFLNKTGTAKSSVKIDVKNGMSGYLVNGDDFGSSVAGIWDFNGDSIPDIAIGSKLVSDASVTKSGAIYILCLNRSGGIKSISKFSAATTGLSNLLIQSSEFFGSSIAWLSNYGYSKNSCRKNTLNVLAVGATGDNDFAVGAGAVWLMYFDSITQKLLYTQKISGLNKAIKNKNYYISGQNGFGSSLSNYTGNDSTQRLYIGAPNDSGGNSAGGTGEFYGINVRKTEIQNDSVLLSQSNICNSSSLIMKVVFHNTGSRTLNTIPVSIKLAGKDTIILNDTIKHSLKPCQYDTFSKSFSFKSTEYGKYVITAYAGTSVSADSAKTSASFTLVKQPKAPVIANQGICTGDKISLGYGIDNTLNYTWSSNYAGFTSTLSNPEITGTKTATYYLTVTEKANSGCYSTDSVKITVNPRPEAKAGAGKTICAGDTAQIGAQGVSGHSYDWTSKPSGFVSVLSSDRANPHITTTYYLTETINLTGCQNNDSVTITVKPVPNANAGSDGGICPGDSITLGMAPEAGIAYRWASVPGGVTGSNSQEIVSPSKTTSYILHAVNNTTGCQNYDTAIVTVHPNPSAKIDAYFKSVCFGQSIFFSDTGSSAIQYLWLFGDGDSVARKDSSHTYKKPGSYKVTLAVTDNNGCIGIDTITASVHPIPSAKWNIVQKADSITVTGPDSMMRYIWEFGDKGYDSINPAKHIYKQVGTYQVKLQVYSPFACHAEYDSTITVTTASIAGINKPGIQLQVYPNPFINHAVISFSMKNNSAVKLVLTDITGKPLQTITDQNFIPGSYKLNADIPGNISPGIYLLKCTLNGEDAGTVMLMKQ